MKDALGSTGEGSTMSLSLDTIATSLDTEKLDGRVVGERVEHADCVAATTNAGHDGVRQLATHLTKLTLGLITNDRLEGTDNSREWMRTNGGADDVMRCVELNDPGAKGLIDSVPESLASCLDSNNLRAKKLHAEDI
jgi:hypothetical protein